MDSAAIEEANKEVTAVTASTGGKRKRYLKLIDEQWATIGCYAAEHGTANAIRPCVFMHLSTVNYLLRGARFFRELHTEAMQSQKFSHK